MSRSLKTRLVITVLLCEALLTVGLLLVGRHYVRHQLMEGLDSALNGRAISVAALVRYPEDNSSNLIFDNALLPPPLYRHYSDVYEVIGPNKEVLARSPNFPTDLHFRSGSVFSANINGQNYRGVHLDHLPILDEETGQPVSPALLSVSYATPTAELYERLSTVVTEIALGGLALLLATSLLAAWLVSHSLAPLNRLAERAGAVSAQNWNFEAPADARQLTELQPLIRSLELMLDGLRRTFEQQRDFIANAAHELKTPVAIQKSTLQLLARKERTEAEYERGIQQCLHDTERLEDLLQRLLRLAKAEQSAAGATPRDLHPQPISSSCQAAISRLHSFAESRHVTLEFIPDGDPTVLAAEDDLETVWSNLLENAIQYSPSGARVTMKVSRSSAAQVAVAVHDTGPGIPPDQLPRIFDRFYRGDQSRARQTGGVGLGLSLVKSLVDAYGGTISVTSTPGSGSKFVVTLPCSQ